MQPEELALWEKAEPALLQKMWHVDGMADALKFAWDCKGDIKRLDAEIQEVEKRIAYPVSALKDLMNPGSSTRTYQDGYLTGLKEAVSVISGIATQDATPGVTIAQETKVVSNQISRQHE